MTTKTFSSAFFLLIFFLIIYDGRTIAGNEASAEEIQMAKDSAPAICDELNQDTIYYHEDSDVFLQCNDFVWDVVDFESIVSERLGISSYYWTPYNAWDRNVSVNCGSTSISVGVITGVKSQHHNHFEDRRFSYKCSFLYDY